MPLHPNTIPTEPLTHISIDMITGLPFSNGHDALLVIVDHFLKAIILVPCNVELSAEGWARILRDHVYARHSMPQVVISDQGLQFISEFMKELYRMLNITQNASTAFHPQTDGQTERVNQEVKKYLWIFISHRQDDWADWLPLAEFAHNNQAHSMTGRSLFMILYDSKVPAASDFSKVMAKIHKETETMLKEAAGQMKAQYDKHKRPAKESTLETSFVGPFKILEKTRASVYKLKLPLHWKIHPCFNEKLLTPYMPPVFPNQEQPPPPPLDLIDSEEQWEVKEVLDSKTQKWKGWTREHNSWVTEKDMGNTEEAIANYVKRTKHNERVAVVKIATPSSHDITMVLNHIYKSNGNMAYLAQWEDRTQTWVINPDKTLWKEFLDEYWASQRAAQDKLPEDEP
ncbi:uncharacterized protein ARMOST_20854 [Armillaria ostoyae]|uniref:Integrase catalytic domain-containing protein n=1 Tax=Armillaria ostoyae TaxID=47428 RepID=A0A284S8G8_ARMOS|nr:uncharacterized protein ARMOST_20854 [Armillaria ostoyae]